MIMFEQPMAHPFFNNESPIIKPKKIGTPETESDIDDSEIKIEQHEAIKQNDFLSPHDQRRLAALRKFNTLKIVSYKGDTVENGNEHYIEEVTNEPIKIPPRPFDAKYGAISFENHPVFKNKNKEAAKKNIPPQEEIDNFETNESECEMLAYYFMELPIDLQDKLLVQYEIIIPDKIRNNLKEMKEFISTNKSKNSDFVPLDVLLAAHNELISSNESFKLAA